MIDRSRVSLCQAMSPDSSFEDDIELMARLGVPAMSLFEAKLHDDAAQLDLFRASGLRATASLAMFSSPLPSFPRMIRPGAEDPAERVELTCDSVRRLAPFNPSGIVLVTGSSRERTAADARRIAVEGLREIAATCLEVGVTPMLEPIRFPGYDASFVRTLPETFDLLDEIGVDEFSVVYDTYHLWDTPDIESLSRRHTERIGIVQVSDWREPPRCIGDRLVPGAGEGNLPSLVSALEEGGYDGVYDVEIFSDDGRWEMALPDSLWLNSPEDIYRLALQGLDDIWDRSTAA